MELVTPNAGTIFWMVIVFGLVVFILRKFAWKPILSALNEREKYIENALTAASEAQREVNELKAGNKKIVEEGLRQKEAILNETLNLKDKIIAEAKEKASVETQRSIESARIQIENEKTKAVKDMKLQVTEISLMIAEKIIKQKMGKDKEQQELINKLIDEIKLN
ncbi:MAG: F0F1 ATP synthase subunit B [Prolixibacteraceae bacterium]|jgi:F-type H+-transporting ATPase subunit b|nr:F0F1 ATP synthase subunit B [Prolixibacteraceae bacterium]MDD4754709.1 F0F1 ATP synthase subunit B [Prolixibacteraceae bacterium]NLO03198.1 F0F1 ATP synthase subunit B [Bacteroidales bacterium]